MATVATWKNDSFVPSPLCGFGLSRRPSPRDKLPFDASCCVTPKPLLSSSPGGGGCNPKITYPNSYRVTFPGFGSALAAQDWGPDLNSMIARDGVLDFLDNLEYTLTRGGDFYHPNDLGLFEDFLQHETEWTETGPCSSVRPSYVYTSVSVQFNFNTMGMQCANWPLGSIGEERGDPILWSANPGLGCNSCTYPHSAYLIVTLNSSRGTGGVFVPYQTPCYETFFHGISRTQMTFDSADTGLTSGVSEHTFWRNSIEPTPTFTCKVHIGAQA